MIYNAILRSGEPSLNFDLIWFVLFCIIKNLYSIHNSALSHPLGLDWNDFINIEQIKYKEETSILHDHNLMENTLSEALVFRSIKSFLQNIEMALSKQVSRFKGLLWIEKQAYLIKQFSVQSAWTGRPCAFLPRAEVRSEFVELEQSHAPSLSFVNN